MPGRKPKLNAAQVAAILEWHRNRKTRVQLARELGVGEHVVGLAIRLGGHYKAPSPETRAQNLRERHELIRQLTDRGLI